MGTGVDQVIYLTHYHTEYTPSTIEVLDHPFPQKVHMFTDTYAKAKLGIIYPPHKMAERVLVKSTVDDVRNRPAKTAFIFASGNSHLAGINPKPVRQNELYYNYKFLPFTLTQVYAGRTAQAFGNIDHIVTDATACASSLKACMDVQTLINHYGFDRVIVLSVEDPVSNAVLEFFGEAQASLTIKDEESGVKPSAFDDVNGGFHVAQGAVLAVFESDRIARRPLAKMVGAYTAAENHTNAIGQREDGQGYVKAIQGAMAYAGAKPSDVRIVKAHGTGTKSNNMAERFALDNTLADFVATSYKPEIGHTMGASGLLETCILLDDLSAGVVSGIANRTTEDNVYLSKPCANPGGLILSLASGMGNVYSAALFSAEV